MHNMIPLTGADPLGELLTFVLVSKPSYGVISAFNSSTGLVSYTPDAGYEGQDSFTFRVKNAPHGIISAPVKVSIDVTNIPDASAQSASFSVNSINNIMILAGQDPLGQALTFSITNGTGPSHGVISGFDTTTGVLSYTPEAGYVGQDSFMFTVTNSNGISSAPAYAIINLTDTPVANARFKNVGVNSVANAIIVTGQDPLARPCTFALEPGTGPSHGCISDIDQYTGVVTYTPECGYAGQDGFMFTITNSSGISSLPAAVTITVIDIPFAQAQSVSVVANSTTNVMTLTGKDPLGEVLVFALEDSPSHGTITSFDAKSGVVAYVPNTKFVGQDAFTFTVTNSPAGITSESATVAITVIDIPFANSQSVKVPVNATNVLCALSGTDPLGQALTFALEPGTGPSHGTLSGFNPSTGAVVYTPHDLYVGQDSFMFTVTNTSGVSSVPALVTIDVVNTPRANARSANVVANASSAMIALTGQDLLGQPLTFALGANPSHGTIASFNPNTGVVSYVPNAGYVGKDAFTFTVTNSSGVISDVATVNIVVADVPCANGAIARVGVNSVNNAISLTGSDPLAKPLTFALVRGTGPSSGTITSFNAKTGTLMYTPSHGFAGTDSCMFTVTNATYGITSAPATVTIAVVDIPVVNAQLATVAANSTGTPIKITGKDPLGKMITFAVGAAPLHGTVSAYNPNNKTITYTPNSGYTGSDTFTITATNSDGITSAPATITTKYRDWETDRKSTRLNSSH